MTTFKEVVDRFMLIPEGQRKFLFYLLCMWTISTIGFVSGVPPISEVGGGKVTILNVEASLRHYLRNNDKGILMVMDMIYTSPIENWWKVTRRWSQEIITALCDMGIGADIAIDAFKKWYEMKAIERLRNMELNRLPINEVIEHLEAIHPGYGLENLKPDVTMLADQLEEQPLPENTWGLPHYSGRVIDNWLSNNHYERWANYDPKNREKDRSTYLILRATQEAYQIFDMTALAEGYENGTITLQEPGYHTNRSNDWNITNEDMQLHDCKLKSWYDARKDRDTNSDEFKQVLSLANLYIQSHSSNTVGWMNSHALRNVKSGNMIYSNETNHGKRGEICLALSSNFCMG